MFIGVGAFIKPVIALRENTIVGVGSLVNKNVETNSIVGGNPAKHIKFRTIE
ncbi:hypothetical protein QO200_08000 [Flavobacterium sp. Arc3]|uniref:acyltransferase n=1 Tax=Flavobacterium sp. Arc3 TaxID=3046686 RepID=UPI00352F6738